MAKPALVFIAVVTLLVLVLAPVASGSTVRLSNMERRVLVLVNAERAERHLAPLRVQLNLLRAARAHSRNMASLPFFSHISPNGRTPAARCRANGYRASGYTRWRVGETIAWGAGEYATARHIVSSWMKSTGHRRILMGSFRDIGLGVGHGTAVCGGSVMEDAVYFTINVGLRQR